MPAGGAAYPKALARPSPLGGPAALHVRVSLAGLEPASSQRTTKGTPLCRAARDPPMAEPTQSTARTATQPVERPQVAPPLGGAQAKQREMPADAPTTWEEPNGAAVVTGKRSPRASTSAAVNGVASPAVALGASALFLLTAFDVFGGSPFGLGIDSLHLLPRFVDAPVHAWVRGLQKGR